MTDREAALYRYAEQAQKALRAAMESDPDWRRWARVVLQTPLPAREDYGPDDA